MKMANTTLFFYQNGKITTVSEKGKPRTIFRADDRPLAELHVGDTGTSGLLATDEKGTVLSMRSKGEERDHAYSAYGHDPSLRAGEMALSFNGERIEPAIECYLLGNGYRIYNPILMRFISTDSLSPFDEGGINPYGYCLGDPVNNTDSSGHVVFTLTWNPQKLFRKDRNFFFDKIDKIEKLKTIKEINIAHTQTLNALKSSVDYNKALTIQLVRLGRKAKSHEDIIKHKLPYLEGYSSGFDYSPAATIAEGGIPKKMDDLAGQNPLSQTLEPKGGVLNVEDIRTAQ